MVEERSGLEFTLIEVQDVFATMRRMGVGVVVLPLAQYETVYTELALRKGTLEEPALVYKPLVLLESATMFIRCARAPE